MSEKKIAPVTAAFESLKQSNEHDAEYWRARDLQPLLGYSQWRRFEQAIERAQASCETSGNVTANHFAGAGKMVGLGSGSLRSVDDCHLSRFACSRALKGLRENHCKKLRAGTFSLGS